MNWKAAERGGNGGGKCRVLRTGDAWSVRLDAKTVNNISIPALASMETGFAYIANYGGGVYAGSGTFTMSGGTISGNTATNYGGGVYVGSGGTFTKQSGGVIYGSDGRTLKNSAAYGSAVCVYARGDTRHCERSEAIQRRGRRPVWIASSLRSSR